MLKESGLLIEFQDKAREYNAYVRNRTQTRLVIDKIIMSPHKAYTSKTLIIEYLKVQGSLYFTYVNLKDTLANIRHDKLVPIGRKGVFIGYSNNTVKHFKAYSPDLSRVHRFSRIKIDKGIRGGIIDLKLRGSIGPQGTPNVLLNRMGVSRLRKQDEKALIIN